MRKLTLAGLVTREDLKARNRKIEDINHEFNLHNIIPVPVQSMYLHSDIINLIKIIGFCQHQKSKKLI